MSRRVRRGNASVCVVVVLVVLGLTVVGIVSGGARDQDLAVKRIDTVRAFYAAEAGVNMALRELMQNSDEDGDGTVGSISADGDDSSDPSFGGARVAVTSAEDAGQTTLTSKARAGSARRSIEALLQ